MNCWGLVLAIVKGRKFLAEFSLLGLGLPHDCSSFGGGGIDVEDPAWDCRLYRGSVSNQSPFLFG